MEKAESDLGMLTSFKASYGKILKDFANSTSSFRLVRTIPQARPGTLSQTKTLYVLDASFNPPTKAHHRIALSALLNDNAPAPQRILLLLATQNADKANKPASLEDRLVMMTLCAQDLLCDVQQQGLSSSIDVGLVKQPYFHDKAAAVDGSGVYQASPRQVHLIGFDTLIRIFNTKYYPPDHSLQVLGPFLSKHRLRVTYRPDDGWGSRQDQDQYIKEIASGKRLDDGAQPEWAEQLALVQGREDGEEIVSSTLARKAAKNQSSTLDNYVMPSIREWIIAEKMYTDEP